MPSMVPSSKPRAGRALRMMLASLIALLVVAPALATIPASAQDAGTPGFSPRPHAAFHMRFDPPLARSVDATPVETKLIFRNTGDQPLTIKARPTYATDGWTHNMPDVEIHLQPERSYAYALLFTPDASLEDGARGELKVSARARTDAPTLATAADAPTEASWTPPEESAMFTAVVSKPRIPEPPRPVHSLKAHFEPDQQRAKGGETARYALRIANTGDEPASFRLKVWTNAPGVKTWADRETEKLAPGHDLVVSVFASVPKDAGQGQYSIVGEVHATHDANASTRAKATLVIVNEPPARQGVKVALEPDNRTIAAGEIAHYLLRVTNTGDRDARFAFKAYETNHKLRVWLDREAERIGAGQTIRVSLYAEAPEGSNGTYYIAAGAILRTDSGVAEGWTKARLQVGPSPQPCCAIAPMPEPCCKPEPVAPCCATVPPMPPKTDACLATSPAALHDAACAAEAFRALHFSTRVTQGMSFEIPLVLRGTIRDGQIFFTIAVKGGAEFGAGYAQGGDGWLVRGSV